MKIVSACLAGIKCNYKQEANSCKTVIEMVKNGEAILVCPEQLGGLTTPRVPAEIVGDKVITKNDYDVSFQFQKGAEEAFEIAKLSGCNEAILKSNSPSCGSGKIYDGTFSGKLIDGDGVFTKLLKEKGISVISEKDLE